MGRIALVSVSALVLLTGCETRQSGDKVEVEIKGDEARREAREAGDAVERGAERAGDAIQSGAQQAGDAIQSGAQQAGDAIQHAGANVNETKQEVDIRAALALDTTVDKSGITVTGDETTKTIKLTGTVPTSEQRAKAEQIARDKAEGWTIANEIQVTATAGNANTP